MQIARILNCSRVLGKAQGYFGLPVRDEVVRDTTNGQKVPAMVTAWTPDAAELMALNQGGNVYVRLFGVAHPPIMLWAGVEPDRSAEDISTAIPIEATARGVVALREEVPNMPVELATETVRRIYQAMADAIVKEKAATDGQ